jgi:hypothetical protein
MPFILKAANIVGSCEFIRNEKVNVLLIFFVENVK